MRYSYLCNNRRVDRFLAIQAFAKVVELGGFARAASRLGVSTSAVSRQVAELEAHLDTRLLNRTTRRISLTETGQDFYERGLQLLADLDEAESSVRATTVVPKGSLKLTCGVTFAERYLAPAIAEFAARHAQLQFDLDLSDRAVDLVDEGFDLAVRIGHGGQQGLVSRRIGWTEVVCCASPAYLSRIAAAAPRQPGDLARLECLTYTHLPVPNHWQFVAGDGGTHSVRITPRHRANNGRMLVELACLGLGIAIEPDFIVAPEVRAGRLVRLLPGFALPRVPIAAVYPSRRHLSAKVRAFVGFLAERFAHEPEWSLPPADPGGVDSRS